MPTTLTKPFFLAQGALTVALVEPDSSSNAWDVSVSAKVGPTVYQVGKLTTRPPGSSRPGARVIALATLPGVTEWIVTATTAAATQPGSLELSGSLTSGELDLTTTFVNVETPPTPSGGGGPATVAWVSSVGGSDSAGSVGGSPFATIGAAVLAASALGVPVCVKVAPGSYPENVAIDTAAHPLRGITLEAQGDVRWLPASGSPGSPQLAVTASTLAANAALTSLSVLGFRFIRTDGLAAVQVSGTPNPARGTSACPPLRPFSLLGCAFEDATWELSYLGRFLVSPTSQTLSGPHVDNANLIETCCGGEVSGEARNIRHNYQPNLHMAEGRSAVAYTCQLDNHLFGGAPSVAILDGYVCANVFENNSSPAPALQCYSLPSVSAAYGPTFIGRGAPSIDSVGVDLPAEVTGIVSSTWDTPGLHVRTEITLQKPAGSTRVAANLRGACLPTGSVNTIVAGRQVDMDCMGSSAAPGACGTAPHADAEEGTLALDVIPMDVLCSSANPQHDLPWKLPRATYIVLLEADGFYDISGKSTTLFFAGSSTLSGTFPGRLLLA